MTTAAPARSGLPLPRLLAFLEQDPANPTLLADAAWSAFDADDLATAEALLERLAALGPLSPGLANLRGLAALQAQRFAEAAGIFEELRTADPDDTGLRFNLAWCRAMLADYAAADALLDEATALTVPRAAALKIEMLHHQVRLEEALDIGARLAAAWPDDELLMAALSSVALDAEDTALAGAYAARAGDTPQGLSTLATLALDEERVDEALALFEQVLAQPGPDSGRALVGKGLVLMLRGQGTDAARFIDRGAEAFGDHLGSWVASGWAHLTNGDQALARDRFERTVALDDTFAEGHGGLAVLDILEGDPESGRRRADIAARLDRQSFSAALARVMLLEAAGNADAARRIVDMAMATPATADGRTLGQAIVGLSGKKG